MTIAEWYLVYLIIFKYILLVNFILKNACILIAEFIFKFQNYLYHFLVKYPLTNAYIYMAVRLFIWRWYLFLIFNMNSASFLILKFLSLVYLLSISFGNTFFSGATFLFSYIIFWESVLQWENKLLDWFICNFYYKLVFLSFYKIWFWFIYLHKIYLWNCINYLHFLIFIYIYFLYFII